ncbi:unnamed protein product [Closterium sp. NIES-54]
MSLIELRKQLYYLLEKKIIRPISSPFAAPILFTPKKDGGFRMCIDYSAQNRVTVKSLYPILRADELIDQLRTARVLLLDRRRRDKAHDGVTSGHFGVETTRQQLQRYYYWPEMLTDVQRHVASCPTCQLMKSSQKWPAGQLQPIPPPERAWQQVTMDFITGLQAGASGNDAILVVVDRLTKMAHFAAWKKSITGKETTRLFISTVIRLHGIPAAIISDHDTKFTCSF